MGNDATTSNIKKASGKLAKILRVRKDLNWQQVNSDYRKSNLNESSQGSVVKVTLFLSIALGNEISDAKRIQYWKFYFSKDLRKYLENFAEERNLDPLSAETWYSLSKEDFARKVPSIYHEPA